MDWLKDYLLNRKQLVEFKGSRSSLRDISCGVPQGSILGPLLFIIYINDLLKASSLVEFLLFADDTSIFISGNCLHDLISTMNNELVGIDEWFRSNKLSLNMDKTNYILFRTRHKSSHCDNFLNLNGCSIRCVSSLKFLGVVIDEHLDWSKHISFIESKISKNIGVIYRISKFVDKKILKITLIASHLSLSYVLQYSLGSKLSNKTKRIAHTSKESNSYNLSFALSGFHWAYICCE